MKSEGGSAGKARVGDFAEQVSRAPAEPGVYLLKDSNGKIIYVGKARSLRDRLRSYTQPKDDPRLQSLVARVTSVDTIVTRSEVEALILEENLIKIRKPRYNVRLRDDKKFPYLKVTVQEPVPRILVTRNTRPDGALLFGPYTSVREMRRALRAVKRIFRVRTCHWRLPDDRPARPCLEFQVSRCTGPCADRVSAADYRQQVRDVVEFLSGRSDRLVGELEARMARAAAEQDFERAALLRDQLLPLRELQREQQVVFADRSSRDVIGLARGARAAVAVMFRVREGKLVAREDYPLTAGRDVPDSEVLATLLSTVHGHTADLPDEIVLPVPVEDAAGYEELLRGRRKRAVKLVVPGRGERVRLLDLARRNAEKLLAEQRPEERVPKGVRELAGLLGLDRPVRVVEGVDISNTQGRQAVGSVVVFRDGRPAKRDYRHYKVRTVEGPNDFAMMAEVLARRIRGLVERGRPLPDLVLVDGGKGQLSAAVRAYRSFDPEMPILGLAKRTDTLFYQDGRELSVPASSPALMLLKRIRDESHRFAITFHRKLRGRKMVESGLDAVPGLGPVRRRALIRHFGSVARLRSAGVADIARVTGIGPVLAEKVFRQLNG